MNTEAAEGLFVKLLVAIITVGAASWLGNYYTTGERLNKVSSDFAAVTASTQARLDQHDKAIALANQDIKDLRGELTLKLDSVSKTISELSTLVQKQSDSVANSQQLIKLQFDLLASKTDASDRELSERLKNLAVDMDMLTAGKKTQNYDQTQNQGEGKIPKAP